VIQSPDGTGCEHRRHPSSDRQKPAGLGFGLSAFGFQRLADVATSSKLAGEAMTVVISVNF